MSQFLTYVLVPNNTKDVEVYVAGFMAPYDKALVVSEYEGPCPCADAQVASKAREMADNAVSTSDKPASNPFERVTATAIALQNAQKVAIQELLDNAKPDPKCADCKGSGRIKTTANPDGKWTSWKICGHSSEHVLANFLMEEVDNSEAVPVNLINLQEAPTPWVIVTPDGKWNAAGDPSWFGDRRIDDSDWENTANNILKQHTDKNLVAVDCWT